MRCEKCGKEGAEMVLRNWRGTVWGDDPITAPDAALCAVHEREYWETHQRITQCCLSHEIEADMAASEREWVRVHGGSPRDIYQHDWARRRRDAAMDRVRQLRAGILPDSTRWRRWSF